MGDDGLPGRHIQFTGFMLNPQRSPQDYGVLVKFRSLARFLALQRVVKSSTTKDTKEHEGKSQGIHTFVLLRVLGG